MVYRFCKKVLQCLPDPLPRLIRVEVQQKTAAEQHTHAFYRPTFETDVGWHHSMATAPHSDVQPLSLDSGMSHIA